MDTHLIKVVILSLVLVAVAGCSSDKKNPSTDSAAGGAPSGVAVAGPIAGGSDLRWRNDAYRELDGDDENAERLIVTVNKASLDSTMVRLEIRSSKDRLLYRHEWPAVSYVKYGDAGSAKDSTVVLRETERQLSRIFQDSSFVTGAEASRFSGKVGADLDAIRYDIGEQAYRTARSLKLGNPIPPGAHDEINGLARAVPLARIQAVAAETRNMPAFKYYAGGEETYVIAWSASEGRMVRIAACC